MGPALFASAFGLVAHLCLTTSVICQKASSSKHQAKRLDMHLDESLAVLLCSARDDESTRSHGPSPEAPLEAAYSFNR